MFGRSSFACLFRFLLSLDDRNLLCTGDLLEDPSKLTQGWSVMCVCVVLSPRPRLDSFKASL